MIQNFEPTLGLEPRTYSLQVVRLGPVPISPLPTEVRLLIQNFEPTLGLEPRTYSLQVIRECPTLTHLHHLRFVCTTFIF
jgi:hypothetical protein